MLRDFFDGIRSYGRALGIISEMRLWKYLILPGLLSLLLAALIGLSVWGFSDNLGLLLLSWIPIGDGWLGSLFERFGGVLTGFTGIISGAFLLIFGLVIYKHLVMVIVSPFMSPLAQKVEERLTGRQTGNHGFQMGEAIKDFLRGLRIALRNIIRELFYVALLFLIGFIPVVGLISTIAIFLVQAFYAGFGNIDYTLERHHTVKESVAFIRKNRWLAIGNGTVFLLLLSIGIGFLFAPPLATVAATIETTKRLHLEPHFDSGESTFV